MEGYSVADYTFPDGAQYSGTLRGGVPDGLGTCVWPDGSQYDGEWRVGCLHGFGTYVWPDGQRYDGQFKVGVKVFLDCGFCGIYGNWAGK